MLNSINRSISKIESNNKQKAAEIECRNNGHIFGEWQKYSWTENVMVWDSGPAGYIPVEKVKWERTCTRCKETVDKEPQELIDARKERNKQNRIKALKKELKRLEGK